MSAERALLLTDSTPLMAADFELYVSEVAIVSPLLALRMKWN